MNSIKSKSNVIWQQKPFSARNSLLIQQQFKLPEAVANILSSKEILIDEIENFLHPTLKQTLPNPLLLLDMQQAVDLTIKKIRQKEKIIIFGDYDVDGATSCALLKRFFEAVGVIVEIYIPDRLKEGYGPNVVAFQKLCDQGAKLIITVDCGTSSFEPINLAKKNNVDVIIIDHHLGAEELPNALVVNPNRLDETFSEKNIAAVAVSFFFLVALNSSLRQQNFYEKNRINPPSLLQFLDLVALGTVCDVMPLRGINRTFVQQGLKVVQKRQNLGLKNLADIAGIKESINSYHLGFVIGPRINAGGRIGKCSLGAELLSGHNEFQIQKISQELNNLNAQRQFLEKETTEEAILEIERNNLQKNPTIIVSKENWHIGVIGIVASRLKEIYNKPIVVIALDGEIGKASCRSISGVNLGAAIVNAKIAEILIAGGGHAMAAGFTIAKNNISDLQDFLFNILANDIEKYSKFIAKNFYDYLDINSANMSLAENLLKLEPYGVGNEKPKFIFKNLKIEDFKLIGKDQNHISCFFSGKEALNKNKRLKGVAFNIADSEIGKLLMKKGETIDIAGQLNINYWQGNKSLQILVEDVL
jgi:single-stranded-DNA-specific exonuclease